MKFLAIFLLLGSLRVNAPNPPGPVTNYDELVARIENKFLRGPDPIGFDEPTQHADVSWIPAEMRQQAVDYLKEKGKNAEVLERAQKPLIALGDEETMFRVIKQFEVGTLKNLGDLEVNLNAGNIKYLVPVIYGGASAPREVGFGKMQSPRRQAIDLFIKSLVPRNGFTGPSAQWAGRLHYFSQKIGDDPHIMWLFQQWWEHNKGSVLAGKLEEANWVPMYKGEMDFFDPKVRNEPGYRDYTSTSRNDIVEIPRLSSVLHSTQAPSLKENRHPAINLKNNRNLLFIVLAASLILLVTTGLSLFRRTKKR